MYVSETKQTLRQSEEKNRKKDKEKIDLDSQLSKAKSEFSKTDAKYKELLEKVQFTWLLWLHTSLHVNCW